MFKLNMDLLVPATSFDKIDEIMCDPWGDHHKILALLLNIHRTTCKNVQVIVVGMRLPIYCSNFHF